VDFIDSHFFLSWLFTLFSNCSVFWDIDRI